MKFLLRAPPLHNLGGQLLMRDLEVSRPLLHLLLELLPGPQQRFLIAPLPASQPADESSGEEENHKFGHFAERHRLGEERRGEAILHSKD